MSNEIGYTCSHRHVFSLLSFSFIEYGDGSMSKSISLLSCAILVQLIRNAYVLDMIFLESPKNIRLKVIKEHRCLFCDNDVGFLFAGVRNLGQRGRRKR